MSDLHSHREQGIAHTRQAHNGPMRLEDLVIRTQTPIDTDKILFEKFRAHERVEFDPRTNLYSFKVGRRTTTVFFFMSLTFTIA
jgi:hypothetical protein